MAKSKEESINFNDVFNSLPSRMRSMPSVERVSSGSVIFDLVLGGGIPRGVSLGIASEPGCGKTTLLLCSSKSFLKKDLRVIYLDFEKGVTAEMLQGMGLFPYLYDPDGAITGTPNTEGKFYYLRPSTFGDGETIIDALIPSGDVGLCVIDSASDMTPDNLVADKTKDRVSITATRPGEQAQLMSRWMQKYLEWGSRYNCTFFYVQQMRTKISFIRTTKEAAGGYAIKHGVSASIMMRRNSFLEKTIEGMDGEKQDLKYGADVAVWCDKSRISTPFLEGNMTILFGKGVSNIYTYWKWLKGQKIENSEGVLKPMLSMAGAGFWTLILPSGEYKARGDGEVYATIKEHMVEIKEYVDSHGGFKLIVSGGTEDVF